MNKGAIFLLVICIVALIGYFSVTGFFVKTAEEITADKLMESATVWLNTEEGKKQFLGGMVEAPIPVYIENTEEVLYWNIPVKNNEGLYLGIIIADVEEFTVPSAVLNYPEPRGFLFLISKDNAYAQMIEEHPEYSAAQISKPRLIVIKGAINWMSEVTDNGEVVDELYIQTSSF